LAPLPSLITSASLLHISILGIDAFSGRLSSDGTYFWAPSNNVVPQLGSMECGW